MLEYVKVILEKVSFDINLFEKELKKSLVQYISPTEAESLKSWAYQMFSNSSCHLKVLDRYFSSQRREILA